MTADERPRRSDKPGGKKPYGSSRDAGRKPHASRDGEKRPSAGRGDGKKPAARRDEDKKPYGRRDDGKKPYEKRDGEKKPYAKRDGDKRPYGNRDGDKRPYDKREGDRKPRTSRPPQSDERRVTGPEIPEEITPRDLHPSARNELKTLSKENADEVARHLAMASRLIDDQPELAHEHALAASRRAGRIAVVRETVAITAYAIGDFALALRELRTYRRISGKDDQIALMVDSERGIGRPDRALETGRAVDRDSLPVDARVSLAIAMSGARLDRGELELALGELEIPELDPNRAFSWSPALFAARATVLEDLGRTEEAQFWSERADAASAALGAAEAVHDELIVEDSYIEDEETAGDDTVVEEAPAKGGEA